MTKIHTDHAIASDAVKVLERTTSGGQRLTILGSNGEKNIVSVGKLGVFRWKAQTSHGVRFVEWTQAGGWKVSNEQAS